MAVRMTAQEAKDDFAETLDQVACSRTRVLVERKGKPLAAIVPVEDLATLEAWDRETAKSSTQTDGDEDTRRAIIADGRGMFAGGGHSVDAFLRERREETEHEEARHAR